MGIESRDWHRTEKRPSRWPFWAALAAGLVVAAWAAQQAGLLPVDSDGAVRIGIGPLRGPAIGGQRPLYAKDDPWLSYLADEQTCPGGEDTTRPLAAQVETMLCLIDFARRQAGVGPLVVSPTLSRATKLKGDELVRCGVFAHAPCGGDSSDGVRRLGYRGAWGENLYVAEGPFGAPRPALDGWLNSESHRENLLHPDWRVHSIHVRRVDRLAEYRDATVWISQFGDR